jgi:DNA-binding MarR family transcriptional regulator
MGRREAGTPGDRADEAKDGASAGRDFVDCLSDDWQAERPDLDRPEYELGKRVVRLNLRLEDAMTECLAPWGLTRADYAALSTLRFAGAPYELRPTDLKARIMLTSGGVSNVLNRLEKAGLIERVWDSADGRSSWVRLTGAGVETADAIVNAWSQAQVDLFRGVPDDVSRAASDALRQVLIAFGDHEPPAARTRKRGSQSPSTMSPMR